MTQTNGKQQYLYRAIYILTHELHIDVAYLFLALLKTLVIIQLTIYSILINVPNKRIDC